MVHGVEIPEINPIPLVKEDFVWYSDDYYRTRYCQKFFPTDKTALQILADAPFEVEMYLSDRHGFKIGSVEITYPESGIEGVYLAELRPNFAAVAWDNPYIDHFCWLVGSVRKQGLYYEIKSPSPIAVGYIDQSCFLEYAHTENDHSVVFTTGIKFGLRIEGGFIPKSYTPASDDSIYKDESVNFVSLKSTPYSAYSFKAGRVRGIPDWLHAIVNRAFSCDTLFTDGVQIVKVEDAEWQPGDIENYDLREWSITVSKARNTGVNRLPFESAAFWSDYSCQLVEEAFLFTVHMGDLSGRLSGQITLTVQRADGATYSMVKTYKGFSDVKFEIPVEEKIVGVSITADGELDSGEIKVFSSLRSGRERAIQDVILPLPATYEILPNDGATSIDKNDSGMLHITVNQPINEL